MDTAATLGPRMPPGGGEGAWDSRCWGMELNKVELELGCQVKPPSQVSWPVGRPPPLHIQAPHPRQRAQTLRC